MILSFIFDPLKDLIEDKGEVIGCVIVSGKSCSFWTICGTEIICLESFNVDLPNKHNKGGQSSVRFARLRLIARENYITKIIESMIRVFGSKISVVIGGPSTLKHDLFDKCSKRYECPPILKVVTTQYDGRNGLSEIMTELLTLGKLADTKDARHYTTRFFESLNINDGLAVYGAATIDNLLHSGLLEVVLITPEYRSKELEDACEMYNTIMIIVPNVIPEFHQIKMGFGGKVGLLRYFVETIDED